MRRNIDIYEIAERYFGTHETKALDTVRSDRRRERFFELWILKEAFLKGIGCGLAMPLDSALFSLEESGSIDFRGPCGIDSKDWEFAVFGLSAGVRMAIAVESKQRPCRVVCGQD
jgi:4'-phosphopantetheinyl transferase